MPAKRPAPKSAKGKKAASGQWSERRSAARPSRCVPGAVAHARKIVAAPKKPLPAVPATGGEPPVEPRKPQRAGAATGPPPATATMIAANRSAAAPAVNADGDDGETIEPGSLLAVRATYSRTSVKRGEQYMSKQQLEHFRFILNAGSATSWWRWIARSRT